MLFHFVHILLILGAFFMLFPFVWMISASFKSNQEIIKSPTDKIVLLPDSIRPSFLNDESDKKRIKEQKEIDDAWYATPEDKRDPRKKPFEWWDNYKNALKAQPFYRFFLNTLFVSITVIVFSSSELSVPDGKSLSSK